MWLRWWVGLLCLVVAVTTGGVSGGNVTYDGRSLIIDGRRQLLFSGSIHYPRSTPHMWPSLIAQAKQGGLDVIDTYVFWNLHEPQPGQYDFSGRYDIVSFIKQIQAQGLYVCLRIGPFIESEWSYGGLPFWLHDVPNIVFRSDNEPFKFYMMNFTTKIVNMLKSENLFASQGGPIIISQIENEYQNVEKAFHEKGPPYVIWAAKMASDLQTGVPWVMCKQDDAPDLVINSCNGMRCGETFVGPNSPNKPALWTENWTHFYDAYGNVTKIRSPEDIAYHTVLFLLRKNGSFVNYYMYHGGTNFGRNASSFILTAYYDQAPLDEYGLIRQPKWGHLKELHAAIKLCSNTLLYGASTNFSLGPLQEASVYRGDSGECAAFLLNTGRSTASVQFQNSTYELLPKSISVLPDCKTVVFNTAKVNTQINLRQREITARLDSTEVWGQYEEVIQTFDDTSTTSIVLLEQMNTTKDVSDYLWYTTSFEESVESSKAVLRVNSLGHVLRAFVNRVLVGSRHGSKGTPSFTLETNISLNNGVNNISLLSVMVGLPDSGAFLERRATGLRAATIEENQELHDLTNSSWGYQVGLVGERLQIYTEEGSNDVQWSKLEPTPRPLTWYKTHFDAPGGTRPVAINLESMGKGEAWVNGESIGRYWISYHTPDGLPSQIWYHIPRSFLKPSNNLLVLLEEESGDPLGVSIGTVSASTVRRSYRKSSRRPPLGIS